MTASPDGPRCTATAKGSGDRCQHAPMRWQTVCRHHGGKAPQTIAKARRRALAAADPLMARLVEIAMDPDTPSATAVAAIRDALDRTPLVRGARMEVEDVMTAEIRQLAEQLGVSDHPALAELGADDG